MLASLPLLLVLTLAPPSHVQRGATLGLARAVESGGGFDALAGTLPAEVRLRSWLRGLPERAVEAELREFVGARKKAWGPLADEAILRDPAIADPLVFEAQKAAMLASFGLRPEEVIDGFLTVAPSTAALAREVVETLPRRLFFRLFPPAGDPSARVVQLGSGYTGTHITRLRQAIRQRQRGDLAVLFDHGWAGHTRVWGRKPGEAGRGVDVAMETAAMAAFSQALAKALYGAAGKVALVGTSMGGSAGVYGALTLGPRRLQVRLGGAHDLAIGDRRVRLRFDESPAELPGPAEAVGIGEGAFFGATRNWSNRFIELLGRTPYLRDVSQPVLWQLPRITQVPSLWARIAWHGAFANVRTKPREMFGVLPDLEAFRELAPWSPYRFLDLHSEADLLADRATAERFVTAMPRGELRALPGDNHLLWDDPRTDASIGEALDELLPAR